MGGRAWDNYEQEAHERWQALPWRQRYAWQVAARIAAILAVAAAILYAAVASSAPISSADIRVIDGDTIRGWHHLGCRGLGRALPLRRDAVSDNTAPVVPIRKPAESPLRAIATRVHPALRGSGFASRRQ